MAVFGQSLTYRDDRGQTSSPKFFVEGADAQAAATNADALQVLITACTTAAYQSARGPLYHDGQLAYGANTIADPDLPNQGGAPPLRKAPTIEDKLLLKGKTVLNRNWSLSIPAPKPTLFLADGETADFADATLAALIGAIQAEDGTGMCDRAGDRVHLIYGGKYERRKTQRRFTLVTKNPQLTGPGL